MTKPLSTCIDEKDQACSMLDLIARRCPRLLHANFAAKTYKRRWTYFGAATSFLWSKPETCQF